ncbi:unnamed protein product [Ectocarpus sp. CCAP 1310/34]|nr:unnamed protein product [Ectocarpus sp. CCAP 1310/34]
MVHAIRPSARVPEKKDCVTTMRTVKKCMMEKVSRLIEGEQVCITSDGWTSCANDTYMSLTFTLITSAWKLVTLSVDCSKSEGTTTGDALAAGIKATVAKHGLTGKVTAVTTDCEPSMVKMGRLLAGDATVSTQIGCCNYRLESTSSIVFNGPRVKKVMVLARGLVTRYPTSSQAADRLKQFVKTYLGVDNKRVIQDVVTGSLVVPFIYDLRNSLEDAIDDLVELPPDSDANVNTAWAAVMPCIKALRDDYIDRWGDGHNILIYKEGPRRQPGGFKPVHVLATALDPRTKIPYGVDEDEKADVWKLVQEEAVKIAVETRNAENSQRTSSQQGPEAAAGPALSSTSAGAEESSRKRPRVGGSWRRRKRSEAHEPRSWAKALIAPPLASSRTRCGWSSRPSRCPQGIHLHTYQGGDLGEEMSHIQGAVVVRRPDLTREPGSLAPAPDMDFVKTLQSYFPISQGSLLRRMVEADDFDLESTTVHVHPRFPTLLGVRPFLGAVREGNSAAAQLLTPYCSGEDPGQDIEDCVRIPTLVSMVDVFVNRKGAVWNEHDFIAPVNCARFAEDEAEDALREAAGDMPRYINSYEKVFMMAQEWGPNYYHFTVEHLPRITLALDILLENPDIMIVMHHHGHDKWHDTSVELEAHMELFELIGISRERIVYTSHEVHANLAIVPTTTNCGDPDPSMINMLRNRFLQGLFPGTDGVPPVPPRPVIVLIVRSNIRGLENNDEVKEALERNFPSFDVVEFFGTDPVRDQLKTFATASMIIAPHGAGLANMIVAPLHTPVLEIAPLECPPCFLRLALKGTCVSNGVY